MDTVQLTPALKENLFSFVEKSIGEKKSSLSELKGKLKIVEDEIKELYELKSQLSQSSFNKESNSSGISHNSDTKKYTINRKPLIRTIPSTKNAILQCLRNEHRLLSTDDLIKLIDEKYPEKFKGKERNKKRTPISSFLSNFYRAGKLKRMPNTQEQGFIYGLTEWFDGDHLMDEVARNTAKSGQNLNFIRFE